jgi:hypothetical protein
LVFELSLARQAFYHWNYFTSHGAGFFESEIENPKSLKFLRNYKEEKQLLFFHLKVIVINLAT